MNISASMVKDLREKTGAGMMDCKKALTECNGDMDKAVDYLREKGIAKAAKKATRIAAEGLCDIKYCEKCNRASMVEVNCETDFVTRNDLFKALVADTAKDVLENNYASFEDAKAANNERYVNATLKIGEKLDFRRFIIVKAEEGQVMGTYIHNGSQIGVIVVLNGGTVEAAEGIAMHIAANNPQYACEHCIPSDVIDHERHIAMEAAKTDPKLIGKPEAVLAKIIDGKVNKLLGEQVLTNQTYLLDPDGSMTVGAYLKSMGASVASFVRYAVGDGIEKRNENFAEEVAKQMM